MNGEILTTWDDFVAELRDAVLPLYESHERTFDPVGVHGRMHVCRAILFAEFMCRHYWRNGAARPAVFDVRYAVAFHDAGREANGPDLWERSSARICADHLTRHHGTTAPAAERIAARIVHLQDRSFARAEERIVHDADVLDIMRPCCGHSGREGFREGELVFLGERDRDFTDGAARARLIVEAWTFIRASEARKRALRGSTDYMADVLGILDSGRRECAMLAATLLQ